MDEERSKSGSSTAIVIVCVLAGLGFLVLAVIGVGAALMYMQTSIDFDDLVVDEFAVTPTREVIVRCDSNGDLTMDDQQMSYADIKNRVEQSAEDIVINVYVDPACPYSIVKQIEDFCVESYSVYDFYFETLPFDSPLPERSAYDRAMNVAAEESGIVEQTVRCDSAGKITVADESFTMETLKDKIHQAGQNVALNIYVDPQCPYSVVTELEEFCVQADHVATYYFGTLAADKPLPEESLYQQNVAEMASYE